MQIAYLDGPRLRRSLLAASAYAQGMRAELNRINVFPVPDGDTGTNLSLTVQAISDHLLGNEDRSVHVVAREAAEAAVLGARGNCGMMLSHFLLGFADGLEGRERITAPEFGEALLGGAESLDAALERPVEGTILTVVRDVAREAVRATTSDFVPLVTELLERAKESLERTPELLPVLKRAGVVDAGAKGFVNLLEGVLLYIHGDPIVAAAATERGRRRSGAEDVGRESPGARALAPGSDTEPAAARVELDASERYRYCTEALVRGDALPDEARVKADLRERGSSLIVLRSGNVLKIHVHTDEPEEVFAYLRRLGTLATHKAEDMRAQHEAVERSADRHARLARRPVAVVTDSANDLPDEVIRAHGIHVVPLLLLEGDRTYRDGVEITSSEFARRLVEEEALPTTSQPAPGDFLDTYLRAAEDGEEILAVVLGSALSGTFTSAETAARRFDHAPVHLVDSRGASLLQGLLTLKGAELAEEGRPPGEIADELRRIRDRSGILFTPDTFDRLLASGRVGKGRAWLGTLLSVKPVLGLDAEGKVEPVARAMGRSRVVSTLLETLDERIPDDAERLRFGIVHVAMPGIVAEVEEALRSRYGDVEVISGPATPVIATHLGAGAWGVAWMVED